MAAPVRVQKAGKLFRKEGHDSYFANREGGGDRPFFLSHEEQPIQRRGKHDPGDDDLLQRKCHECEEEEKLQRKCQECEEEEKLQRKEEPDEASREAVHEDAHDKGEVQRKCSECEKGDAAPPAVETAPAAPAHEVQTRLTVGAPDDPYEREADQMGEKIMRMPFQSFAAGGGISTGKPGNIQRNEEEAGGDIQAKGAPGLSRTAQGGMQTSPGFSSRLQSSGGGDGMAAPVQQHMESAFQADFSAVRIHTGSEAAALSSEIGAQAFTYHNHIYFNDNKYSPESSEGRFLLAHELTHTVQQGAAHTVRRDGEDNPPDEHESFWNKLKNGFDSVMSTVLPGPVYRIYKGIRDGGLVNYVKNVLLGLFKGLFSKLGFSDTEIMLIIQIFIELKNQLPKIVDALGSGDCKPLFAALDTLSTVVSAIAGRVWDRLMEAIEPIRQWLLDVWNTYLSPVIDEIKEFLGEEWDMIKTFGKWIWQQFQPIIQKGKDIWAWVMNKLGFGDDPNEEGLVGFISRKVGEAWDAIKKELKPVIDPINDVIEGIKSIVSLEAIRKFQEDAKKWLDEVAKTATAMGDQDDAIKNKQLTLREVLLPALNKAIDRLKETVQAASVWVMDKVNFVTDKVNGFVTGIQNNSYVSALYSVISWVPRTVDKIHDWASDKVVWIFDKIQVGIDHLREFIDPVLKGLEKIVDVVSNLLGKLPDFITGGLYGKIPKCIKDPIIDWITEVILKKIPVIAEFIELKDKWDQIRSAALTVLKQVFVDGQLARALWTFFRNLMSLLGIDPTLVTTIVAKAAKNFSDIISKPGAFLKNVWEVVKGGFNLFWDNIGKHLLQGALDWLFGEVKGAVGAKPPKDFTLGSILGYILDLFGISKENVYKRMELNPRIGPEKVATIRKIESALTGALEWITVWIKEGPEGLLRKAKEKLSSIKDAVINSIVGWVTQKVSAEILKRLATSSDPLGIGATINTIILIYDTIKTAVAYINRMLNIANKAMDNLADIIAGNLDAAKTAFEEVLGKAVPVVVGFAVEVIIGPVGDKIQEIVTDARTTVDEAIDSLINGALDMIGSLVDTAKKGVKKVLGWLGVTKEFKAVNGEDHELSFAGTEQNATLMIASGNPVSYEVWLEGVDATDAEKAPALKVVKNMAQVEKKTETESYTKEDKEKELRDLMDELSDITGPLFAKVLPKTKAPKYEKRSDAGWGTGMEVDGLTKKGLETGTTPSVGGGDFDVINRRRYGNGSYYILGHLLNMKLGGPGNTWDNLTPITRSANSNHESIAEARVKNAVDAGNIVKYTVTAEYSRPSNTKSLESAIDASNINEDKEAIKEIIRAEASVPTKLICVATMKNPKTNEETTLVPDGTTINNRLDQGPSDYSLTEGKRSNVYLDRATAAEISSIGKGMDLSLAKKVVKAYKDHGVFYTLDALTGYEVNGKAYFNGGESGVLEAATGQSFVKLFKRD